MEATPARPFRAPERRLDGERGASGESLGRSRVDEAIESGYQEGLRRGQSEAEQRLAEQLIAQNEALARTLGELNDLGAKLIEQLSEEILGIALKIASRIVRDRVQAGDPVAARVAGELLSRLGDGVRCRVRVHPADQESILVSSPRLREAGIVELVPDPAVSRGGVVIESDDEELDARLTTAYQALWEAVTESR